MANFKERIRHTWNAFMGRDAPPDYEKEATTRTQRPDRIRRSLVNEKSLLNAAITRMAMDAASIRVEHCRVDSNENYIESITSSFNEVLNLRANIDESGRAMRQNLFESMLDEGNIALFPVDTDDEPEYYVKGEEIIGEISKQQIFSVRVSKIIEWSARKIKVRAWDDQGGLFRELTVNKDSVFIMTNPFYSIMNEPNSMLRRVARKMALLDQVTEQTSSGKLDMILQLPFSLKSPSKRSEAQKRKADIEMQLRDSRYGIAYIDATEKITQLNRPIENNLLQQIEFLTNQFYSQMGITNEILNGTADEKTMINYYNRCIEPLLASEVDEYNAKYLTKTAYTQGQRFKFFRDLFKMVPAQELAEIADKLTRNEIASSNEIRAKLGWKPSSDPRADELRNSNIKSAESQGDDLAIEEDMATDESVDSVENTSASIAETIIPGG